MVVVVVMDILKKRKNKFQGYNISKKNKRIKYKMKDYGHGGRLKPEKRKKGNLK